jgi:hypothetical protein
VKANVPDQVFPNSLVRIVRRRGALPGRSLPLAALLVLALPVVSRAQLGPGPVEGEQWVFSTNVGRFQTDNLLLSSAESPGDSVDVVSVALLYGRRSPRQAFSAYGRVSGDVYETFNQYSQLNYGGGLGLSLEPSRTSNVHLSVAASSGSYAPVVLSLGVAVPEIQTDVASASLLSSWHPGPRTTLTADGSFAYIHYSSSLSTFEAALVPQNALVLSGVASPEQVEIGLSNLPTPVDASLVALALLSSEGSRVRELTLTTFRAGFTAEQALTDRLSGSVQVGYRALDYGTAALVNGGQLDSGLSLRLALSNRTSTTLRYTYQKNSAQLPAVSSQAAMLFVEHDLSPHLKLDASLGLGASDQVDVAVPASSSLLGGLGLSGAYRRTRYDVHYSRSLNQAYGFGRNYLTDYATAFVEQTFSKRLTARADLLYRHSQDVYLPRFTFTSQIYRASASYRIQRRTHVGAFYSYRIIDYGNLAPTIKSSAWGFSLAYARSLK